MDYKKIIYTFIFIASCLLTIIVSNVVAHSLTIPVDNIVISHNENINDQFAYWQEEILKMDAKCTKKYERLSLNYETLSNRQGKKLLLSGCGLIQTIWM